VTPLVITEINMLEINTKAFGKVSLSPDDVIRFPEGLYGFSGFSDYVLLKENEDSSFQWLQSVTEPDLAFIVTEPNLILKNSYIPEISRSDKEAIGIDDLTEVSVYLIITIPEHHPEKMTANLQGPLIIKTSDKTGRQIISMDDSHIVRYPILDSAGT
jgi:flagellar assembly factor FliW